MNLYMLRHLHGFEDSRGEDNIVVEKWFPQASEDFLIYVYIYIQTRWVMTDRTRASLHYTF